MLVEIVKLGKEERVAVTSLDVAETFGKEHYHVLEDVRAIQGKISTPEFSGLFLETAYTAENGKKTADVPYGQRWLYSFSYGLHRGKSDAIQTGLH